MSKQHMSLCFYVFGNAPLSFHDLNRTLFKTTNKTIVKNNPAKEPSTLLFGLTLGKILCFPIAVPTKYAAESHTHIPTLEIHG